MLPLTLPSHPSLLPLITMMIMIKVQAERKEFEFHSICKTVTLSELLNLSGPRCNHKIEIIVPLHRLQLQIHSYNSVTYAYSYIQIQLQMHSVVPGAELSSQQMVLSWCVLLVIVAILLDCFCTDWQMDLQWSWMSRVGFRVLLCQEGFSP